MKWKDEYRLNSILNLSFQIIPFHRNGRNNSDVGGVNKECIFNFIFLDVTTIRNKSVTLNYVIYYLSVIFCLGVALGCLLICMDYYAMKELCSRIDHYVGYT